VEESLPGDEIVPHPRMTSTHAVTIDAPADEVWPWLVQIGQDKAGFYSYRGLENLVLCHMPDAHHVVPEFQHIRVGDTVWLHPHAPPLPVERVEYGTAIVLGTNTSDPGTWAFYIRPLGECTTRLVVRGRSDFKPGLLKWFTRYVLFEPAHFIMERKMLLGIKARAEAASARSRRETRGRR
jgi:hypothetical protein